MWPLLSYAHSTLMTLLNLILRKIVKIILFFNITLWWPFVADGSPLSPCSTVRSTAVNWSFWGYRFRFLKFETLSRHGTVECTIKGTDRLVQSVEQMGSIRSEIFPTASKCVQLVHSLTRKCYFPSKILIFDFESRWGIY